MDQGAEHLFYSAKSRISVGLFTLLSGLGTVWDILPVLLGIGASVLGIVVSLVVLKTTNKRSEQDTAKHELEMSILRVKRIRQLRGEVCKESTAFDGQSDSSSDNK